MKKQISNTTEVSRRFMNVENVDKIEVFWLNRYLGKKEMEHPVAKKRASAILRQIRCSINIQTV